VTCTTLRRMCFAESRTGAFNLLGMPACRWADFVERYDSAATLFCLDPPYWGSETDYGASVFARADFFRLAVPPDRHQ
jgi:hypothetical protein